MDVKEVIRMYNDEGMTLVDIARKINSSKSSISRALAKEGYAYSKTLKKYIHETENTGISETGNTGISETVNKSLHETENTVNCTFALPKQLHRELKARCALNGISMVDFVREQLEKALKSK